ncbi:HNH endonuclease [Bacillus tuaregi]|uniref:HNH endonuclease n=1 Tax=Bacillus tuaregi TaxID=1816695 RepID=UPI000A664470|nr:HNH endonuclease [Bacillus tuaregi]
MNRYEWVRKDEKAARCELCGRHGVETTVHHLLPKEMGGTFGDTALLCIPCHKQIHALYSNTEIAARLSTLQELRNDEKISSFIKWLRRQPPTKIMKIKKSKERRKKR